MYSSEQLKLTPEQYLSHLVTLTEGLVGSGQYNHLLADRRSDGHLVISDAARDLLNELIEATNRVASKDPEKFCLKDPTSEFPLD
jgi:hypothetical protein